MKVTDKRLQDRIDATQKEADQMSDGGGGIGFMQDMFDELSMLKELKSLRKIDIAHTLKYAEEAGAACEEMKHGIEEVMKVIKETGNDATCLTAYKILEGHLSKYLDE